MTRKVLSIALMSTALVTSAYAQEATLTIESWRNDDLTCGRIRSFQRSKPNIPASR